MTNADTSKVWRPNLEPHPTVPGANVCMIENVTTRRGKQVAHRHREATMKFPDGGWIKVEAHPISGWLGIASYYNGADRVEILNVLIAEQVAWLEAERQKIAA